MSAREREDEPAVFVEAVRQLREAVVRPEVVCEHLPAPQRIAPYSAAVTADVVVGEDDLATGRVVLLHDPDGNDAWQGTFRLVTFARADLEPEMISDPALAAVGWSWLIDSLVGRGAELVAPSGTVTSVVSEGFGQMAGDGQSGQIEVRASWTPVGDVEEHVSGWADLLCTLAGLPPLVPGVVAMPVRRRRA